MNNTEKIELFESRSIPSAVAQLAIPTVLSSLVMVLYNLADTYFVGMLGDPIQNAAVTLAAPVLLAFNAVNNLFGVGSSSMMSRAMGSRDYPLVSQSSAFGFYCALFSGILFSAVCTIFLQPLLILLGATEVTSAATQEYMFWTVTCGAAPSIVNVVMAYLVRSEGSALHASIGTMSGCILNMILDPIFILPWGFNMGVAGAGLATFLSNCVACLYFFVLLWLKRGNTFVCIDIRKLRFTGQIVVGVCSVGIPASIQNLLNVTGMTILNNFTAVYGADAVAAMGISHKIAQVPFQVALGLSQGVMPLIGYNFSSGNTPRMKAGFVFAMKLMLTAMLVSLVFFQLLAGPIVRAFMDSDVIVAYGTSFLRANSLALPFLCMDFLAVGVFQSIGYGRFALLFAILRKIVFEIPALYILNWLLPLYGLPFAQPVAEVILAVVAVVMLSRIFRTLSLKTSK